MHFCSLHFVVKQSTGYFFEDRFLNNGPLNVAATCLCNKGRDFKAFSRNKVYLTNTNFYYMYALSADGN